MTNKERELIRKAIDLLGPEKDDYLSAIDILYKPAGYGEFPTVTARKSNNLETIHLK